MTNPSPPDNWPDPTWSASPQQPQSTPPADPLYHASGQPFAEPVGKDPYAPADPYLGGAGYPAGGYPVAGPAPYAAPGYGYGPPTPRTNNMAVAALILALVGFASCITAPVGAILGHVAQKQIRQTGEGGEGMAKAAIIVGWILTSLMVLGVLFYVAAIIFAIASSSSTSP
ncbi:DUF4190 domain-containing protein [Micromonospora fluostatini]|uniref:DUF4190 domain-containing protein n=1 Tax=Micromonospora sp. JCM 30529 TaxID=3421643 RepID=UPI003D165279